MDSNKRSSRRGTMNQPESAGERVFTVFLVAGEESGDQLGEGLMKALQVRLAQQIRFVGIGGERMASLGLSSLFPMSEIGLHGIADIVLNLHRIVWRMRWTAQRIVTN